MVAVPSEGIRSPRISREMVEWSTPDCCASWRCDIFLALSCARSHSLNARPFSVVIARLGLGCPAVAPRAQREVSVAWCVRPITRWYSRVVTARRHRGWGGVRSRGGPCMTLSATGPRQASDDRGPRRAAPAIRASAPRPPGADEPLAPALARDGVQDRPDHDDREHADHPVQERDRRGLGQRDLVHEGEDADDAGLHDAEPGRAERHGGQQGADQRHEHRARDARAPRPGTRGPGRRSTGACDSVIQIADAEDGRGRAAAARSRAPNTPCSNRS